MFARTLVACTLAAASTVLAAPCSDARTDAEVAACAREELQDQVDGLRQAYRKLAEALGPRAATGLPADQEQWLRRVTAQCRITARGELERIVASSLDTPQTLCLKHFVEARTRDLASRMQNAAQSARAFVGRDYPPVATTWGDRLNPGGKAPLGRFAVFYLRSGTGGGPATLVATDTVREVSVKYPWADFHGIKSEDFEAYWVGQVRYEKETPVYITVDQSWARTRVIIDRKLVYEGGSNARVPYVFSPGTHTVEVEYVNNWHTTNVSVTIADAAEPVERSELRGRLRGLAPANAVVQLAAVYESGSSDNGITLNLAPSPVPVILVLSSYSAVRWVINNPAKTDVRAIVYAPGARIQTESRDSRVPRILVQGGFGSYDTAPRCHCVGGLFHCEGGSLGTTVQTMSSLLGFPVAGYAGEYASKALAVPTIAVTPEVLADARATLERLGRERNECRKTTGFQR